MPTLQEIPVQEVPLRWTGQMHVWNKKCKGYRFKLICDELKVAFKPRHNYTVDLGGYAKKEDSGSNWRCALPEDDKRKDDDDMLIFITWKDRSCINKVTSPCFDHSE